MKKRRTKPHTYLWSLLISVTLLGLIINLLWPDRGFSATENRSLQTLPLPTAGSLYDGEFGVQLEDYASDQLVGRDFFFHVNYLVRKLAGQREINDVYLGRGALFLKGDTPVGDIAKENIEALSLFAQTSELNTRALIVPSAGFIESDRLPLGAPAFDQAGLLEELNEAAHDIKMLDFRSLLEKQKKNYIFYRSDHHLTSYGAGLASSLILQGTADFSLDQYDKYPVSNTFQGTLASKTGSLMVKDDVDIYVAKNNPDYIVTYSDGTKVPTIYNTEALYQKDQYELFLGKNQAVVQIETLADTERSLLIIKDSYANAMVQFLLPYYRNIVLVDPRYYYDDIDYLITANQITDVCLVCGWNTLVTDSALQDVLNTHTVE